MKVKHEIGKYVGYMSLSPVVDLTWSNDHKSKPQIEY